jgi:hypothetical protein
MKGSSIVQTIPFSKQLYQVWPIIVICIGVGLLSGAGIYIFSQISDVPPSSLTRDAVNVLGAGPHIGLLSTLGVMLWTASSAVCLLGGWALRRDAAQRQARRFLFASGLLSLGLALDDGFLVHEALIPKFLRIPEPVVFVGYLVVLMIYLAYFVRQLLHTDYVLFVLALLFLGMSALIDQALPFSDPVAFIEDILKFAGILFWLAYYSRVTVARIQDMATDT